MGMQLLGAILYDPAAAVSKATSALLAMTVLDTTNLRITFTVPASGIVRVRIACVIRGAASDPAILLGVMNGATVVGRVNPSISQVNVSAYPLAVADFTITGLAAGSVSWDAAYAVQVVQASSNIQYGGPNNNSGLNAFGGFVFEVYDPQYAPANFGALAITAGGIAQADIQTIKTQAVTCAAGVTIRADIGAAAAPGSANGMLIGGSNAATTFATVTVTGAVAFQSTFAVTTSTNLAALSASTATFSGAVAFQSTFAVTTSTSLAALSCTTLTASGAVAFQSTFATTGTTTFNALTVTNATTLSGAVSLGSTLSVTGTVTVNAFTCTNNFTVSGNWLTTGTTTWAGAAAFTAGLTSNIAGSITSVTNQLTAAQIATGVWTDTVAADFTTALSVGKSLMNGVTLGTGLTVNTVTNQLTAAAIATGVWQDATASDFTLAGSIGKSVLNGVVLGTGLTVNILTNLPAAPTDWLTAAAVKADAVTKIQSGLSTYAGGAVASVTGNVGGNVNGNVVGNAGTLTGDFSATMKASLNAATPAVTVSDKTGFSLTAAYDAAKTAAQPGDAMGLTVATGNALVAATASQVTTDHGVGSYIRNTEPDNADILLIKAKTDNLPASPAAVGSTMTVDMTQAISSTQADGTFGAAFLGMEAQSVGKWTIVGTTLTLYRKDGTTVVRTFTLDSATAPTSRT